MAESRDIELLTKLLVAETAKLLKRELRWEDHPDAGNTLRESLSDEQLTAEESRIMNLWEEGEGDSRNLFDRLIETRINRSFRSEVTAAAKAAGVKRPAPIPRIVVVRLPESDSKRRKRDSESVTNALAESNLIRTAGGGEVDLDSDTRALVITNQTALVELRETLAARGDSVAFHDPQEHGHEVLTNEQAPVIVLQMGDSLVQLEDRLCAALPEEQRVHASRQAIGQELAGLLFGGKYRIKGVKGKGGFGTVYEAVDEILGARVAVKVLNPYVAQSKAALKNFLEEAKLLTDLDHPNIVRWITFDRTKSGLHYLVMEYIQGEELDVVLDRERRLPPKRTQHILLQILAALRKAHNLPKRGGLLHLDMKPQNVFLIEGGPGEAEQVKVIDFGISQHVGSAVTDAEQTSPSVPARLAPSALERSLGNVATVPLAPSAGETGESSLEQSIVTVASMPEESSDTVESKVTRVRGGTLLYASPEQCEHLAGYSEIVALDGRSDLYSLGIIAFKMLTGQYPFERCTTAQEALYNHIKMPPRRTGSMGVRIPRKLAAFVDKCLVKDRDLRWKDSNEAYAALDAIVNPSVWKQVATVMAPLFLVLVPLLWYLWPKAPGPGDFDVYGPAEVSTGSANGEVQNLVGRALYFGPDRTSVPLELRGLEEEELADVERTLRLVLDRSRPEETALAGWRVERDTAGGTSLVMAPEAKSFRGDVFLQLDRAQDRFSPPFRLIRLTDGEWSIASAEVSALAGRALDPEGQSLRIQLRGDSEDLAKDLDGVSVRHGEREFNATRAALSAPGAPIYSVDLQDLGLEKGSASLTVVVRDRAGTQRILPTSLDVETRRLRLERVELVGVTPTVDGYIVSPADEPVLRVELNRPAQLSVLDADGTSLSNTLGVDASFEVPLSLAKEREGQGRIVVAADDNSLVLRQRKEAGQDRSELRFLFTNQAPDCGVRIARGDDLRGTELDSAVPHFLGSDEARLIIERRNTLPVVVRIECLDAEGRTTVSGLADEPLVDRDQTTVPFTLPEDGSYRLCVSAFRAGADEQPMTEKPEFETEFTLVLDRLSPEVRFADPPSAPPVMSLADLEGPLEPLALDVVDASMGSRPPTPVELRPTLLRRDPRTDTWLVVDVSLPPTKATPGEELDLFLPSPWADESGALARGEWDGSYRLQVAGADAAGNEIATATYEWVVAAAGPRITLERPTKTRLKWRRGPEGLFEIEVRAADPNGVERVSCRIVDAEDESRSETVELSLLPDQTVEDGVWRGTVDLRHGWSRKEVGLLLEGVDRNGTSSAESASIRTLDEIERYHPGRVHLVHTDSGTHGGAMRPVRGNSNFPYAFGGRGDQTENREYSRVYGMELFDSKATEKSWDVVFEPSEIADFYLDEREVSVEEYLAFLDAGDVGYGNAALWPHGSGPDSGRRALLAEELERLEGALPMTGVSWPEAAAYARWVGKRLPTYVEWEFAVRGKDYRPHSSAARGAGPPERERFNYDPLYALDGAPWPVHAGEDVTPDTLVRNLCSNVSEWTVTPVVEAPRAEAGTTAGPWGSWGPWDLQPAPTPADAYWVVGGSYRRSRWDFTTAQRAGFETRASDRGFRCALSADLVLAAFEEGPLDGWRAEEVGE